VANERVLLLDAHEEEDLRAVVSAGVRGTQVLV
jgi:hypothetical protein